MHKVMLVVPVLNNFLGFAKLLHSVDFPIFPLVVNNWDENRGVAKSWNYGIESAIRIGVERCLVVNDDVVFHPLTIIKLIQALDDRIFVTANAHESQQGYANSPDFCCFMVKPKEFVNKYGWFDENFYPAYFEDNNCARVIELSGDQYECRLDATVTHEGSVTQNSVFGGVVPGPMFEENKRYYIEKWGGMPGSETYLFPFNDPELPLTYWDGCEQYGN